MAAATSSSAAINVVALPGNGSTSVNFTHLGVDDWSISTVKVNKHTGTYQRISGDGSMGSAGNTFFTQGIDLTPNGGGTSVQYSDSFTFDQGAGPGINYLRLDLDNNTVFETVVQFDFGLDEDGIDDVMLAYAYDTTGANLEISAAAAAIPEPSHAGLIGGILTLALVARRRRS